MVTTAQLAAALLAVLEGLRLTAYKDAGGVLTIGIGHTGPDVSPGMTITAAKAVELFQQDQGHLLGMVTDKPILEAAALVSFGFNCGAGALSSVLTGRSSIDDPKWTHDRKGNVLPGLVARRQLESMLIQVSRQLSASA